MAQSDKFRLLTELGTVVVPSNYDHETAFPSFLETHSAGFVHIDQDIINGGIALPNRILKGGDRFKVSAFSIKQPKETRAAELIDFLDTQKAVFVGIQGLTIVFKQRRALLPPGKWLASFCSKSIVYDTFLDVPGITDGSDGGYRLSLGGTLIGKYGPFADARGFFCFSEI